MAFYTRTQESSGIVIWTKYDERPAKLGDTEEQCSEADYLAGRTEVWGNDPLKPSTQANTGGKNGN